jgi:hypothetical protein
VFRSATLILVGSLSSLNHIRLVRDNDRFDLLVGADDVFPLEQIESKTVLPRPETFAQFRQQLLPCFKNWWNNQVPEGQSRPLLRDLQMRGFRESVVRHRNLLQGQEGLEKTSLCRMWTGSGKTYIQFMLALCLPPVQTPNGPPISDRVFLWGPGKDSKDNALGYLEVTDEKRDLVDVLGLTVTQVGLLKQHTFNPYEVTDETARLKILKKAWFGIATPNIFAASPYAEQVLAHPPNQFLLDEGDFGVEFGSTKEGGLYTRYIRQLQKKGTVVIHFTATPERPGSGTPPTTYFHASYKDVLMEKKAKKLRVVFLGPKNADYSSDDLRKPLTCQVEKGTLINDQPVPYITTALRGLVHHRRSSGVPGSMLIFVMPARLDQADIRLTEVIARRVEQIIEKEPLTCPIRKRPLRVGFVNAMDGNAADDVKQRLKDGEVDIVVAYDMLGRSADYPMIDHVLILRSFTRDNGYNQLMQKVGRALRRVSNSDFSKMATKEGWLEALKRYTDNSVHQIAFVYEAQQNSNALYYDNMCEREKIGQDDIEIINATVGSLPENQGQGLADPTTEAHELLDPIPIRTIFVKRLEDVRGPPLPEYGNTRIWSGSMSLEEFAWRIFLIVNVDGLAEQQQQEQGKKRLVYQLKETNGTYDLTGLLPTETYTLRDVASLQSQVPPTFYVLIPVQAGMYRLFLGHADNSSLCSSQIACHRPTRKGASPTPAAILVLFLFRLF